MTLIKKGLILQDIQDRLCRNTACVTLKKNSKQRMSISLRSDKVCEGQDRVNTLWGKWCVFTLHIKLCVLLAYRILIANSCTRWRWIFTGLSQDGGGWGLAKLAENLRAFSFNSFRMRPRLSWSISLDSTFNSEGENIISLCGLYGLEPRRITWGLAENNS